MGMREIRLQRRAAARKYTLEEVGTVLGVNLWKARELELDTSKLSVEQARKVAEYLGCDLGDL